MSNSSNSIMLVEKTITSEFNHTEHIYIDICGDLIAGTLLSQILYWFKPSADGSIKVRIRKEGHLWLAKRREDWWSEIRITPKQYDRAIRILQDKGFVVSHIYKFDGAPVVHIRPIPENINREIGLWAKFKAIEYDELLENDEISPIFPKGKNGNSPKGKMDIDERGKSITEITT